VPRLVTMRSGWWVEYLPSRDSELVLGQQPLLDLLRLPRGSELAMLELFLLEERLPRGSELALLELFLLEERRFLLEERLLRSDRWPC
jgi:hypothetical protein